MLVATLPETPGIVAPWPYQNNCPASLVRVGDCQAPPSAGSRRLCSVDDNILTVADEGIVVALQPGKEIVVISVRADPKPVDRITFAQSQCAPTASNPNGVDRLCRVYLFEVETRMPRVLFPQSVVLPGLFANLLWQGAIVFDEVFGEIGVHSSSNPIFFVRPTRISSRTLSANLASRS